MEASFWERLGNGTIWILLLRLRVPTELPTAYVAMFRLNDKDLAKLIIGVGDGPACFGAEARSLGYSVVSVDPIYRFSNTQIQQRIDAVTPDILKEDREASDRFVWKTIPSPDSMVGIRHQAMTKFLEDREETPE